MSAVAQGPYHVESVIVGDEGLTPSSYRLRHVVTGKPPPRAKSARAADLVPFARFVSDQVTPISSTADGKTELPASPSSEMITFTFENGSVVTLRTSGTEPKLKYYVELRTDDPESAQADLEELVGSVIDEFLQPDVNDLEFPE